MANDNITININKRVGKIVACVVAVIIALGFIPSEQEVRLPQYESSTTYSTATSYDYKIYQDNTACWDAADEKAKGDSEVRRQEAAKCKGFATNLEATALLLSNGPCNYRYDYRAMAVVSECDNFYLNKGKLYSRLNTQAYVYGNSPKEYRAEYSGEVKVEVVSGSSIRVETYYTKKCHAFGLICSSGDFMDKDTHINTRLVIGKNANIKRYNTTCDRYSGKTMLNEDTCIYANDTYKNMTIDSLLKI